MRAATVELTFADVPLVCEYEFDPGESAVLSGPPDNWHPGCSPAAVLMSAKARDSMVDLMPLLDPDRIARLEHAIVMHLDS